MEPESSRDEERIGIRLNEESLFMLGVIAARRFPGEQRKQSETIRRLIREEYERIMREEREQATREQGGTGK